MPYLRQPSKSTRAKNLITWHLRKCHLFLGDMDEAMKLFRKGQATNPGSWIVQMKLAGALGLDRQVR